MIRTVRACYGVLNGKFISCKSLFPFQFRYALTRRARNLNKILREREESPREPVIVDDGPVQEVVYTGDDVDLYKLPIWYHNEKDAGPYITSGMMVTVDPETGTRNVGMYRHMLQGKAQLGIHLAETGHGRVNFDKYMNNNKPMPIAITIGHHPLVYMGALSFVPYGVDEYTITGGYMQEPLRLVKCKTVDMEVPADAEIVLEGTVLFSGSVFSADKMIMRVATPTTNDPQTHEMALFKKEVESKSQGKIEVQLFPSCQLGSNAQMLQGLQAGTIHGLLEPTAFLGGFSDVLTVVDLPYFFENVWTATDLLNGPAGDSVRKYLEARGLVAAAFYPYGDRILLLKFPVQNIEDFKGRKIRVMGTKCLQNEIKAWGGAGIPMDVPELYTALQQGVIDGLGSAAQFFYMLKYFQVAGYIFTEPKGAEVTIFMMNKKWLEKLPADLRDVVLNSAKEIIPAATEFARSTEKDAMDKMAAAGVKLLDASPDLLHKLKSASGSVHETFLQENPDAKPIYENLKKTTAK